MLLGLIVFAPPDGCPTCLPISAVVLLDGPEGDVLPLSSPMPLAPLNGGDVG